MKGHKDKAIEEFKGAIRANRKDTWSYKLLSAYAILDTMGAAVEGSPLNVERSAEYKLVKKGSDCWGSPKREVQR